MSGSRTVSKGGGEAVPMDCEWARMGNKGRPQLDNIKTVGVYPDPLVPLCSHLHLTGTCHTCRALHLKQRTQFVVIQ